jgi:hypothetical protein
MRVCRVVALATVFFLAGCGGHVESEILRLLAEALPESAEPRLQSTCHSFLGLGPAVALFEVPLQDQIGALAFTQNDTWARHQSLPEFVEQHGTSRGPGLGATILDGKECIRKLSEDADTILFEGSPGLYFSSGDERVVIILFDEPRGTGAIFIQAP